MIKTIFFPYAWHIDEEEEDVTAIRIYGLNKRNENVCVRVDDFTPFVYIELPEDIPWTMSKAQLVANKLDVLLGDKKPLTKTLMYKYRLYYAHLTPGKQRKTFPYLFLSFSHPGDIRALSYKIKQPLNIIGVGNIKLRMHEQDASPILQLTAYQDIPTAGWVELVGKKIIDDEKITLCHHEYKVKWKNLKPHSDSNIAHPLIMGFDIEVNSTNPSAMPKADKPGDKIFQISCVFHRHGESLDKMDKCLLSLGEPDHKTTGEDTEIQMFETESDLLLGFVEIINEKNPNIIVGYNIFTFDIPYMIERAQFNYCINEYDQQGFVKNMHSKSKTIKWSSSAYGNQTFEFLDAEGRLFVDLLPLVKRDYKMDNYKLKTISTFFIGATKDPLSVKGIFKCYRIGVKNIDGVYSEKAKQAMAVCGKYCIMDSILVVKLFDKLQTWIGLCEMAKTCQVPIFFLYTQGQQIKVYSQLYKYCMVNNIVVEKDGYIPKDNEHYVGAYVFDPNAGVYDKVIPFDFSSLYPSTIIAYNIDYSTLVINENIPDSDCHVMEWDEHVGCKCDKTVRKTKPKHILCGSRKFRFLKEPKGVMPTVLQNLLDARAYTRAQQKVLKKIMKNEKINDKDIKLVEDMISNIFDISKITEEDRKFLSTLYDILEKRQLAYKISANSMYGAMGVTRGYLPFMPGAMCTTAMGRKNINIVAHTIVDKYKGQLIYGDSVVPTTPILCKYKGLICYRTIENLSDGNWVEHGFNKEIATPMKGYEVWTENGFTHIKKIIRHKCEKEIIRVNTHTGIVDVTTDHSLLTPEGKKISPKELAVGSFLLTSNLPDIITEYDNISEDEAYVWGMFFAEGSCVKSSWAINNQDLKILEKCKYILNKVEKDCVFKILDTMKSSSVYKLVPTGKVSKIVEKYRELFYDNRKYKIIPDLILNSTTMIRQSFLDGYFEGDGSVSELKYGNYRFDNKGQIGSASLYYLAVSLGYKVSLNTREDKPDIYRLTCTKSYQRKQENVVKKLSNLGVINDYVYDLETENHHFSAGIGKLIVHNTDSNYVTFPHLNSAHELWDYAIKVAEEISKMFPPPMNLEFEKKIYWRFFILTKKRYMYKECERDGIVKEEIGKKGVLLARRDNSSFIREIYSNMMMMIFNKVKRDDILYYIIEEVNKLCCFFYSFKNFVVTKSVNSIGDGSVTPFTNEKGKRKGKMGDYIVPLLNADIKEREKQFKKKECTTAKEFYLKCLPAQIQLAEKMRDRGQRVDVGTRLEYVVTTQGGIKAKQYDKVEDAGYFAQHSSILRIEYYYYLGLLSNSVDDVLNVIYDKKDESEKYQFKKDFMLNQYNYRAKIRDKMLKELENIFRPKFVVIE